MACFNYWIFLLLPVITSCSILDRAQLLAAFDSTGCSSAWLKAIPHPSLGLTMPVAELVVAVHLWLGVPLSHIPVVSLWLNGNWFFVELIDWLVGCFSGQLVI